MEWGRETGFAVGNLSVMNDAINLNLGAPKAVVNYLTVPKFPQIQLPPTMQTASAKQASNSI
jgi:hypothetical protein